jgi:class 3 adenylate cyclase/pimeloyl-ACP methyl ester carboxylesterase
MTEPTYRFCTSSDGTRLAYGIYGNGPPLLFANTFVLSMDAQFRWPEARAFFDALARHTTLVIFDQRGSGASMREVTDYSEEAVARDVEAVADAAGLKAFPLFADATAGAGATCFASRALERVQRLIIWEPTTSIRQERVVQETIQGIGINWSYYRRLWAGRIFRDGPVSLQKAGGQALRQTISPQMFIKRTQADHDIRRYAAAVKAPTLVLQRADRPELARRVAIDVAGLYPIGEMRLVPGNPATPYPEHEAIVEATLQFLGLTANAPRTDLSRPSGTAIILFADIADSTALTERLGDATFRAKARELGSSLRNQIREANGTSIEGPTLGDGLLATFASAREAIAAALSCAETAEGLGLSLHLGLHAGDVSREKDPDGRDNVYGGAVNVAARISGLSAPGEVLVSHTVRDLARTSAGVRFEDRGEHVLKGVGEAMRVWAVRESS